MVMVLGIRDPECELCKLHRTADRVCITGRGEKTADIMIVGKMPNSRRFQAQLEDDLTEAGIDIARCFFTQALKCFTLEQDGSNLDVKTCRTYLEQEIAIVKPKWILAMGNEALLATTGHSGIMKYRSHMIDRDGYSVFPTISPSAAKRNPGQRPAYMADLRFFAARVLGIDTGMDIPKYLVVDDKLKLKKLIRWLQAAELISYDIETTGGDEFDPDGRIVSLSGTLLIDGRERGFALPLYHPESPWRRIWQHVVSLLARFFERIPKQIAHNGKFDARWLRHFGLRARVTFDTMLAAHLLDENRQKGLKPQGMSRLGVEAWAINTKDLLTTPLAEVLEYNFLDTYYTFHIYLQLRKELIANPRLANFYQKITIPANEKLIDAERRGVWADRQRIIERRDEAQKRLEYIERQIMKYVPSTDDPAYPKDRRGRPLAVNFNPSNFARWWIFEYLGLPVLARGKNKPNGDPGDPSMAEAVMLELKGTHPAIDLLMDRQQWFKMISSFFNAYEAIIDENDRIHTTFKLAGTVTGRLSSGKADEEKITAQRGKLRGVNLQQVPRDEFVRGVFGAAPGYAFVEADFSQIEMRLAGYLAREEEILRLYRMGADIHTATAMRVLGVPASQITKEVRKKAKPVNFGFLYGMGWRKFIETAFLQYGVVFTEYEAQAYRKGYFEQFPGLLKWHNRQRSLVAKYKQVQSPLGRIRHLPDIDSEEEGVRHEAERQAINSPVQSMASDMAVFGMILIGRKFEKYNIDGHIIGLVHDAVNFEINRKDLKQALPIIKDTLENLPLQKHFGFELDVPIIADLKVGQHWGGASELTEEQVYDWSE